MMLTVIVALQNYVLALIAHNKPALHPEAHYLPVFNPGTHLLYPFINYGFWSFLSPLVWRMVRSFPPLQKIRLKNLAAWALGGIGLSLAHELTTTSLFYGSKYLLGIIEFDADFFTRFPYMIGLGSSSRFIEFWMIFFGLMIWNHYQAFKNQQVKFAEIKSELSEAKLHALTSQLQPHFLFNTLNSISALITRDVEAAKQVLSHLAQLLRALFKQDQEHLITLEEELEYIEHYLKIEQARFCDRLQVCYDIHPGCKNALVPKLILQPLVENAIKHGISKNINGGKIVISSDRQPPYLMLKVWDNGGLNGNTTDIWKQAGVGLTNSRERIRQIYGSQHEFALNANQKQFEVEIRILFEKN